MKRLLFILAAMTLWGTSIGQSLDLQSLAKLRRYKLEQRKSISRSDGTVPGVQGAMITLKEGYTVEDLRKEGVDVKSCRANIAICIVEMQSQVASATKLRNSFEKFVFGVGET